jgi:hypothetical protein
VISAFGLQKAGFPLASVEIDRLFIEQRPDA